jgi:hypothetical protein
MKPAMVTEYSTQSEHQAPPKTGEGPDAPALAEKDVPVDAFVYDIHPALTFPTEYPYGPRPPMGPHSSGQQTWRGQLVRFMHQTPLLAWLTFRSPTPAQYYVPQRFGMSAILGIMTAMALLFGGLQFLNADGVVYLFFGLQAIVICVVQMFSGKSPRLASAATGAILAPLFSLHLLEAADIRVHVRGWDRVFAMIVLAIPGVPIGAFLGYLTGTCAAGVFLVMETLERYWRIWRAIGD